jgi:anti-sigma factor RsiW
MRDLIESYLDGELGDSEKTEFELHVASCADCAAELALARRVSAGLDALGILKAPATIEARVFAYAKAHPQQSRRPWWWLSWRPALVGATAMVLLAITGYVGQNGKQVSPQFTRAQLEQAHNQAKWTMVFINQLTRKTASTLKHDVMEPHVTQKLLRVIDPKSDTTPKEMQHAS